MKSKAVENQETDRNRGPGAEEVAYSIKSLRRLRSWLMAGSRRTGVVNHGIQGYVYRQSELSAEIQRAATHWNRVRLHLPEGVRRDLDPWFSRRAGGPLVLHGKDVHYEWPRIKPIVDALDAAANWLSIVGPEGTPQAGEDGKDARKPLHVDSSTFSIRWKDRRCEIGNKKPFRLFERLSRRPGSYVSYTDLGEEVWGDRYVNDNTIQQAVTALRRELRQSHMEELEIDGRNPGHYALKLP